MSLFRPSLGHGIGLRPKHFSDFLSAPPPVAWVEVVTENVMAKGGRPVAVLEKVRREVPIVLHGVALSIGSTDALSETYLAELERAVRRFEPALVSDHLCWGTHGNRYGHDLWPLPYTEEALDHVVERVKIVQEKLSRQILLENVSSYLTYPHSTLTEWEFLSEVADRADCGILLDVNNVYVSAFNHGFEPLTYLSALPAERVMQVHLAGHTHSTTHLLDTHDAPVAEPVWNLYRQTLHLFGPLPTLIEWDDHIPPLDELVAESQKAARIERELFAPRAVSV